ncbi:MAG: 3D-(3,5/4)-trihydroxycyclohexane-1,2-dione acylhydrolase (decyclizing) [Vicinamibacteria bacterium]
MKTRRLTTAQALVQFLVNQHTRRDGVTRRFIPKMLGIFGHGNVAGLGEALQSAGNDMPYIPGRNEQALVHAAAGYAKMMNRLQTLACTTSVGPGATNMITGAAGATINRVPVLLLPGDIFATRQVAPVLQQLESASSQDVSVNDCFKPVSRYWDRINRPEQLVTSALEALRVLTSVSETGAVTLCLPEDVQSEAWDFPEALFEPRIWDVRRPRPDTEAIARAVEMIRNAERPLIVAGGGVIYSEATAALAQFTSATGIPVAETHGGKGALAFDHPSSLGAIGATGTKGANVMAREADLVIGIGTRYSDFTTASKTAFQNPNVRFININVGEFDAYKHSGLALVADAREALTALSEALAGFLAPAEWRSKAGQANRDWDKEVERIYTMANVGRPGQGEVIGAVNDAAGERGVVVCAAGSLPGDLHRLWRARDAKSYHMEYGYSCMGYEVAGGVGVKMAAPDRDVIVMVGDGSWLMMSSELVTARQEGVKLIVVLIDNGGYGSIGSLSTSLGSAAFGTQLRYRGEDGALSAKQIPVDYAAHAASLGLKVVTADTLAEIKTALVDAKASPESTVILTHTDPSVKVGGYESWWDVPPAEVTTIDAVRKARVAYDEAKKKERWYL